MDRHAHRLTQTLNAIGGGTRTYIPLHKLILIQSDILTTTTTKNKGQSHLALDGTNANMLFGGREVIWGSLMVPLDRALLSSYRQSIVTIPLSVTVWLQFAMQILIGVLTVPCGDRNPSNTMLLGTTRVSLPNGI